MSNQFLSVCRIVRVVVMALSLLLASLVLGQTSSTLTPKWMSGGWHDLSEHPKFSADGSRVLVWKAGSYHNNSYNGALAVYDANTSKTLCYFQILGDSSNGDITGAALSPNGSTVYYGTTGGIFAYDIAKQSQVALPGTGASAGIGPRFIEVTGDGKTLGYALKNAVSPGEDRVCLYDLSSTQLPVKKFSLLKSATGGFTTGLKFTSKDQSGKIVVSGPTTYDFAGNLLQKYQTPNGTWDFAVSPDSQKVYSLVAASTYGTPKMAAFNLSDVSKPLWSVSPPGSWFGSASVTFDGKAIVFSSEQTGGWVISGLKATDGTPLQTFTIPVSSSYNVPFVATSPVSSQILIGPEKEPSAQLWSYDSSTGIGKAVRTFFEGSLNSRDPSILGFSYLTLGSQAISEAEYHPSSSYGVDKNVVVIRNAQTGTIMSPLLQDGAVVSPDGKFYAYVDGKGVGVYTLAGSQLDSLSFSNSLDSNVHWAGNQKLLVTTTNYYNGGSAYILGFNGTLFSSTYQTISMPYQPVGTRISPDGTKMAFIPYAGGGISSNSVAVYDLKTGKLYQTIGSDSNSYGIDSVSFSQNNRLGIHETLSQSSTYTNEYRVFDVSLASPSSTPLRKLTYVASSNIHNYSGGGLSPDGKTIVLGHAGPSSSTDPRPTGSVRLYAVSSGQLITEWDNQFVPDTGQNYDAFSFSYDSSTVFWSTYGAIVAAPVDVFFVSVSPTSIIGGATPSPTGTITLSQAKSTDTVVTLASSSPLVVGLPSTVTVKAGSTTAQFAVTTYPVDANSVVTISGTNSGVIRSATMSVVTPTALALTMTSPIKGGSPSTGTLTLNGPAGPSGVVVTLVSKNTAVVSIPGTVTIPKGATSATFTATTVDPPSDTVVEVDASTSTLKSAFSLTVQRSSALQISFDRSTVKGGDSVALSISLLSNPSGTTVTLGSNSGSLVPRTSVTIPAGQLKYVVGVKTLPTATDQQATLTAKTGTSVATAGLSIQAPLVLSVTCPVTAMFGVDSTFAQVTLDSVAPAGFTINCSSSDPHLTIQGSFPFTPGHAIAEVPISVTQVTTTTVVTVTISINGKSPKSFTVILLP